MNSVEEDIYSLCNQTMIQDSQSTGRLFRQLHGKAFPFTLATLLPLFFMSSFFQSSRAALAATFAAGTLIGVMATGVAAAMLGSGVFVDVKEGSYYDSAVGELYADGIIKGMDATHYRPEQPVTRADIAVLLQRLRNDIEGRGNDTPADRSSSSRRSTASTGTTSSSSSSSAVTGSANPKGTVRFTTTGFSVGENVNSATISVVRVGGNQGTVAVNYAVTAGTATSGTDFETISGTLTFENKETSKTFSITIKDDSSSEGNETVTLTLSAPTNGVTLGSPNTATLTIQDNEASNNSSSSSSSTTTNASSSVNSKGTLSFAATTYAFNENSGNATITVQRVGGTNGSVTVNYATSNGTGQSGLEYTATNGTLSFAQGEGTKTFTVAIADDSNVDGSKTFNVTLSSATNGANIGTPGSAVVMVNDNESDTPFGTGSLKFAKGSYDVQESNGKVEVTVQRSGGAVGPVSVNYATTNGSAMSGSDYTTTSGTLTFAAGETAKIISIPIVRDSNSEQDDNFYVDLSAPTHNAVLISPFTVTINIFD
jgi:hypothetical protein